MSRSKTRFKSRNSVRLAYLAIGSAIAFSGRDAFAQSNIVPDETLGSENSQVIPNAGGRQVELIEGGARRGANLFHSFREFNVDEGRGAYFANPNGVENILSRVTGTNASNILGTLGVLGNANLFLINPNGIIFGQNASLDLQGSFVATTANAIQFGQRGFFSASEPNSPPLLTVNPSAFLFNQIATQQPSITVSSSRLTGFDDSGNPVFEGLKVPDGQSLLLLGGDVNMNGGRLSALGGRVELGAVGGEGTVKLNARGNNFSLSFPNNVARADVSLTNGSLVNVAAGGGGSIAINAQNLEMTQGSQLQAGIASVQAGIASGLGSQLAQAGDVTLKIANEVNLSQSSGIENRVNENAIGNAGDINVRAGALNLTQGGFLSASTLGRGNGGNITVEVDGAVKLEGVGNDGSISRISSVIGESAVGNGGNIQIQADSLSLTNSALLNTSIFEATQETPGGKGNAGNINITTGSLELSNGSQLDASTNGQGNAGSININARKRVSFDNSFRGVYSGVDFNAEGNAGNINITTGSLELSNGSQLDASTNGQGNAGSININARKRVSFDNSFRGAYSGVGFNAEGNAGNINITTGSLELIDGAQLDASTNEQGNAGNININARNTISFDGFTSGASSEVGFNAKGNAGNINITTGSLELIDGAQLDASTDGQGNAGNININARDMVSFDGFGSGAYSQVRSSARGNGGNINVTTGSLLLTNDAQLDTSTLGEGNAGNINTNARELISFKGSDLIGGGGAFSDVYSEANGNGGNINIITGSLQLTNGAQLDTSTSGEGNAGKININAREFVDFKGSGLFSQGGAFSNVYSEANGNGGNINVITGSLQLTNVARLGTSTSGEGNAGNININARDTISADGLRSGVFAEVQPEGIGTGGNITITTRSLFLTNGAQIRSAQFPKAPNTSGKGNAGEINITARDMVWFDGETQDPFDVFPGQIFSSGAFSSLGAEVVGKGGSINITTGSLLLTNGAQLSTSTFGRGDAGNININARDIVSFKGVGVYGDSSTAFSAVRPGAIGDGGNINIETGSLVVTDGAQVSTSTEAQGNAGDVNINARDRISFEKESTLFNTVESEAVGKGGNINIKTGSLVVTDGSQLSTGTRGQGDAGNISINARDTVSFSGVNSNGFSSGVFSTVESGATSKGGGDIQIQAGSLFLDKEAAISAATARNTGGNIALQVRELLLLRNNSLISTNAGKDRVEGNGGNIDINSQFIIAVPQENSDITANAFEGRGGNVNITSQGIFGTQFREEPTNLSDITASSEFDSAGVVEIDAPELNPSRTLVNLPTQPITTEIVQACTPSPNRAQSEFVITGRGGLPPTPSEVISNEAIEVDWVTLAPEGTTERQDTEASNNTQSPERARIIEAQGWVVGSDGKVILTAQASTVTPQIPWFPNNSCR
jgi:filamentous hemagglutinin family protein